MSRSMRFLTRAACALLPAITLCTVLILLPGCSDDDPAAALARRGQTMQPTVAPGGDSAGSAADSAEPVTWGGDTGGRTPMDQADDPDSAEVVDEDAYTGPGVLAQIVECVGMHPEFEEEGLYDVKIIFIADLPGNKLEIPAEYLDSVGAEPGDPEGASDSMEEMLEESEAGEEEPASEGDGEEVVEEEKVDPADLEAYLGHNVWEFTMFGADGSVVATDMREAAVPTMIQGSMVWKHLYCHAKPVGVEVRLTDVGTTSGGEEGDATVDGRDNRGGDGGSGRGREPGMGIGSSAS